MRNILDFRKKITARKWPCKATSATIAMRWLAKHREIALFVVVTAFAAVIRYCGRQFVSADMRVFLLPWFDRIEDLGAMALSTQVGDYNLPYQVLVYVGTILPVSNPIFWYKGISIAFDFVLAVECYLLTRAISGSASKAVLCYSTVLILPTVFLNSAVWGQCDSIYCAFAVASLRRLLGGRPTYAAFLFGVALSFKLQAVFLIPFFLYWLLKRQMFSLRFLAAALLGFYLLCLPAIFGGRSLLDPFVIYLGQTGAYASMYLNYPSFWVMVGNDYGVLKNIAIALTFAVLAIEVYLLLGDDREAGPFGLLLAAAWMLLTCVYFLPAMHERYGYVATVLLVVAAISSRRPARYLPPAVVCVMSDSMIYSNFLFGASVPLLPLSIAMLFAWLWFSWLTLERGMASESDLSEMAVSGHAQ